mmetsp:Transcript_6221/g.11973  ORF Transcript_6221/g.11973 Transcript_6221/m.11973 type:complete len:219 (-) Transcript_6221:837-1493(-)
MALGKRELGSESKLGSEARGEKAEGEGGEERDEEREGRGGERINESLMKSITVDGEDGVASINRPSCSCSCSCSCFRSFVSPSSPPPWPSSSSAAPSPPLLFKSIAFSLSLSRSKSSNRLLLLLVAFVLFLARLTAISASFLLPSPGLPSPSSSQFFSRLFRLLFSFSSRRFHFRASFSSCFRFRPWRSCVLFRRRSLSFLSEIFSSESPVSGPDTVS